MNSTSCVECFIKRKAVPECDLLPTSCPVSRLPRARVDDCEHCAFTVRLLSPHLSSEELKAILFGDFPRFKPVCTATCRITCALGRVDGSLEAGKTLAWLLAVLIGEVRVEEDRDYLLNLFNLGQYLQEDDILFEPALTLERRLAEGEFSFGEDLVRALRLLVVRNQADDRLRGRWLVTLQEARETTPVLLDAFRGLYWLPFEDSVEQNIEVIAAGMLLLATALEGRAAARETLTEALTEMRNTMPADRWRIWLSSYYWNSGWPSLLVEAAAEAIPGLGN